MDQKRDPQEESSEMNEKNIKQFIETARHYLFGLVATDAVLATISASTRKVQ